MRWWRARRPPLGAADPSNSQQPSRADSGAPPRSAQLAQTATASPNPRSAAESAEPNQPSHHQTARRPRVIPLTDPSANLNLILRQTPADPISGSSPLRASLCEIERIGAPEPA